MPELIWRGKYNEKGQRAAPLRLALPFQTVETVNEAASDRQRSFALMMSNRPAEWRNLLVWGDKKYWEGELSGPALRNPGVRDAWQQVHGAPPTGDVGLDGLLDSWRDADRRYWEVMGISR